MWVSDMHAECKVYVRRHAHKISREDVSFLWYVKYNDYTEKKLIKRRVTCNSVTGVIRVARSRAGAASPSALQLLKSTELSLQVHSTTVPNSLS